MPTTGKLKSIIDKITLTKATFHNEVIYPAYINYFYGGNGSGKSTIARAIKSGEGINWSSFVTDPTEYERLVFNQDFINEYFNYPDELQAVFSVGEKNNEAIKKIEKLASEKESCAEKIQLLKDSIKTESSKLNSIFTLFYTECWDETKIIREDFDSCIAGKKNKTLFADAVLNTPKAIEHDLELLKRQYDVAFDNSSRKYSEFSRADGQTTFGRLPGRELLDKEIVSRNDSPFGQFINALKATDWVTRGHELFSHEAGKICPYCQQQLPDDFEQKLANSFDQQYKNDVSTVTIFSSTYAKEMDSIVFRLNQNLNDTLPSIRSDLLENYKEKIRNLADRVSLNKQYLESKVKEPSKIISLEDTDSLLIEIGKVIDEINKQIVINNEAVEDKGKQKKKCEQQVWEHIAFFLHSKVSEYKAQKLELEKNKNGLERKLNDEQNKIRGLIQNIGEEQSKIVNSGNTIDAINNLLHDSGFQGFEIKEKSDKQNYYQVIRKGETEPAQNLSEGEKNFIAFLYFYELTKGSVNPDSVNDKIVVIDDPVSSMDSNALFIVSAIIERMVRNCASNTNYHDNGSEKSNIKQIFILTHNAYFHREITHSQEKYWGSTSFFIIRKSENISSVTLCTKPNPIKPSEDMNYNPVQNSYSALWDELSCLNATIPALDVMRRILDYYFMQICGYSGNSLRKRVLVENKDKFIKNTDTGDVDNTNYLLASSMLKYMDETRVITDDLNYVCESDDVALYKDTFKLIFEAMGQIQHYNMMMKIENNNVD